MSTKPLVAFQLRTEASDLVLSQFYSMTMITNVIFKNLCFYFNTTFNKLIYLLFKPFFSYLICFWHVEDRKKRNGIKTKLDFSLWVLDWGAGGPGVELPLTLQLASDLEQRCHLSWPWFPYLWNGNKITISGTYMKPRLDNAVALILSGGDSQKIQPPVWFQGVSWSPEGQVQCPWKCLEIKLRTVKR